MSPNGCQHVRRLPAPAASSSAMPSAALAAWRWRRCLRQEQAAGGGSESARARSRRMLAAKAKSVIFLFMAGGPSHLETFDPKPLLNELHGQTRPAEFGEAKYQFIQRDAKLLGTQRKFQKYGQSGIDVSDLFPHTAKCIDDLAVIRSCHGDMVVHSAAQYELFSGRITPGFPSMGSWMLYGLGSRERVAAGVCRDARSQGGLRSRPADVHARLSAGRLSADDVPPRRAAGAESRSAGGHRSEQRQQDRRS